MVDVVWSSPLCDRLSPSTKRRIEKGIQKQIAGDPALKAVARQKGARVEMRVMSLPHFRMLTAKDLEPLRTIPGTDTRFDVRAFGHSTPVSEVPETTYVDLFCGSGGTSTGIMRALRPRTWRKPTLLERIQVRWDAWQVRRSIVNRTDLSAYSKAVQLRFIRGIETIRLARRYA